MNVLMIANSLECYGANNSMLDMIAALKEKGINILVFVPGKGEFNRELRRRCIRYFVIPYYYCADISGSQEKKFKKLWDNICLAWKTRYLVKEKKIDLIHTNASNVDFGIILAAMCNLPHVWHIRELLYEDYRLKYNFPNLEKKFMRRTDCLIYISRFVAEKRKCGGRYVILRDGLDIKKYKIHKSELFSNHIIRILYCGIISKEKGTIDAIRAVKKMIEWGYTNVQLDIVGTWNDYCMDLINYVKQNELDKYIFFRGYEKNMYKYRQKTDIAVMCSRNEALGRVVVESMLGECLMIGANSGGIRELIKDGKTGYLYEPGNSEQLAHKICLVIQNIEESKKIVKAAKNYAENQFDSADYAKRICKIYTKCLQSSDKQIEVYNEKNS